MFWTKDARDCQRFDLVRVEVETWKVGLLLKLRKKPSESYRHAERRFLEMAENCCSPAGHNELRKLSMFSRAF